MGLGVEMINSLATLPEYNLVYMKHSYYDENVFWKAL